MGQASLHPPDLAGQNHAVHAGLAVDQRLPKKAGKRADERISDDATGIVEKAVDCQRRL